MFEFIQLTALTDYGAVAQGSFVPLGAVTRRFSCGTCNCPTFVAGTTGNNTVTLNDAGYYKITYTGNAIAGAATPVTFNLLFNGATVYTASETATAIGDTVNLNFSFIVRVLPNCASIQNAPATIQLLSTGAALTGGTGNLIIEKIR